MKQTAQPLMSTLSFSVVILVTLLFPLQMQAQVNLADDDGDGLVNVFEMMIGTSYQLADSDGDGFSDRHEVFAGFDPLNPEDITLAEPLYLRDTDGDGLTDYMEVNIGSEWKNVDTDNDGHIDGLEIQYGFSPLDPGPTHYGKRIEIDRSTQKLSYYVGDLHLNTVLVSTGRPGYTTPAGNYSVLRKLPVHVYAGPDYYLPNTKWNLMFKYGSWGNYYIHGAYWHNNFGNVMSHGCVNVAYRDVEHLYHWSDIGTPVVIR